MVIQEKMSSSELLYSLFDQHVKSTENASDHNDVSSALHKYTQRIQRLHCIKEDAINEAMTKVECMVRESITQCASHIKQTLNAIDNMSATHNTLIEQELLLSEAQLLTAASALKEFHAQITCAVTNTEMYTRNKYRKDEDSNSNIISSGSSVLGKILSWFTKKSHKRNIHSSENNGIDKIKLQNEVEQSCTPSVDYYKYFDVILTVLESSVARWRLQLVLCKEELALYKNELVLFGHAGVLTCSETDVKLLNDKLACISSTGYKNCDNSVAGANKNKLVSHNREHLDKHNLHDKENVKNTVVNVHSETDQLQPHFGLVTSVSRHTRWLFNDIVKMATGEDSWDAHHSEQTNNTADIAKHKEKVYSANIHDTIKQEQLPLSVDQPIKLEENKKDVEETRLSNVSSGLNSLRGGGGNKHNETNIENTTSLIHMTQNIMQSPELMSYSSDEEQVLQRQMMALHEEQERASASEAKQIETAVRELSQLTSLMNEQVVLQSEQFDVVLKNTEEAQRTMSRAVREVNKASQHFWNSTRQLIVLLWLCTLVLLVANWLQSEASKVKKKYVHIQ